jgi:hypothetical protein
MRLSVFWSLRFSIAAFLCCLLSWHPGDFRFHPLVAVSAALIHGAPFLMLFHKWMSASLGDVLRLGDWSSASMFFRSYHAL